MPSNRALATSECYETSVNSSDSKKDFDVKLTDAKML
jgi:hypothetical protein